MHPNHLATKAQVDRLVALHKRYFEMHDDTFDPGGLKGRLRRLGLAKRAPLDEYVPELDAMHNELAAIAADWKPRLGVIAEIFGDSEAAADAYDSVAHLDTCVAWLHQIASRYASGRPYPEELVIQERMAYEQARAAAHAHAARMNTAFSALARRIEHEESIARIAGFTDHSQLLGAIALAQRAGINSTQAGPHYQFLVNAFGAPAVEAAITMLLAGTFDERFRGHTLEAALDQLSQENPDPVIDRLVDDVLNDTSPPSPTPTHPKPPTPGSHGDDLPF